MSSDTGSPERKGLLLKRTFEKLKIKKKRYLAKINKYRKLNNYCDSFIAFNSTVSSTCLILSFTFVGSPLLIISMVCSFVATITIALKKSQKVNEKLDRHKSTYLSLTSLVRELELELAKEYTDDRLELVLENLFDQLSLIEGNSIPLSESDSR